MTEHNFEHMRRAMVASQLRTTGVNEPGVLAAIGAVPRERFVPENYVSAAYTDFLVPLGHERDLNTPMSLGRMLSEAKLQGDEHVLVIGCATGYAAAVVARLARSVVALEEQPELAAIARTALADSDVKVVEGPLNQGWAEGAPYDFVLLDGAIEYLPQAIIDQVAEGGEVAAAILDQGVPRLSVGKVIGGSFGSASFSDSGSALLPGFLKPRGFSF